jgi:hypothetical protein
MLCALHTTAAKLVVVAYLLLQIQRSTLRARANADAGASLVALWLISSHALSVVCAGLPL